MASHFSLILDKPNNSHRYKLTTTYLTYLTERTHLSLSLTFYPECLRKNRMHNHLFLTQLNSLISLPHMRDLGRVESLDF